MFKEVYKTGKDWSCFLSVWCLGTHVICFYLIWSCAQVAVWIV